MCAWCTLQDDDDEVAEDEDEFGALKGESFCSRGELFVGGSSSGDVIQGSLGDCWFLGALRYLKYVDPPHVQAAIAQKRWSLGSATMLPPHRRPSHRHDASLGCLRPFASLACTPAHDICSVLATREELLEHVICSGMRWKAEGLYVCRCAHDRASVHCGG
jgi:Calpain family cysteine protease